MRVHREANNKSTVIICQCKGINPGEIQKHSFPPTENCEAGILEKMYLVLIPFSSLGTSNATILWYEPCDMVLNLHKAPSDLTSQGTIMVTMNWLCPKSPLQLSEATLFYPGEKALPCTANSF